MTILEVYDNVDWPLLRQQKETLVMIAELDCLSDAQKGHVEGVVNFLDTIQDRAAKRLSESLIFGQEAKYE